MNPNFKEYKVNEIKPIIDHPLLNTKEKKDKFKSLLPKERIFKLIYQINNINSSIANYIRVVATNELLVKKLDVDEMNVDKKYDYIIPEEIKTRLRFIPIHQNVPDDAIFNISYVNNTDNNYIYSDLIKGEHDKYIHKKIRLTELPKGEYLKIKNITVKSGYGYEFSAHSLTSNFSYKPVDYINIKSMNNKLTITNVMCKTVDILNSIKNGKLAKGSNSNLNFNDIENKVIIQVSKDIYESNPNIINIKYYDYVILEEIEIQSCMLCNPTQYKLSFVLQDVYDNNKFMDYVLRTILENLLKVKDLFKKKEILVRNIKENIYEMKIPNIRKTLYHVLYFECFHNFPEIQSIKYSEKYITIQHSNYETIINKSIDNLINKFTLLLKSYNGLKK